jgi:hypothetical protein
MAFMAAALPFIMAGGKVIEGIQGYNQGQYTAAVAKQNAAQATMNADRAVQKGQLDAYDADMQLKQIIGQQTAAQSASGIAVGSGSSAAVQQSQQMIGAADRTRIVDNAGVTAYNYRVQANDLLSEAKMAKQQANNALMAGFINAGTSLMGASSSTGPKWAGMKSGNGVGLNTQRTGNLY